MRFQKFIELSLDDFSEEVQKIEEIAASPEVAIRRSWFGGWEGLEGWLVSWSMSYKGEEQDPNNRDVDAYGTVRLPDSTTFWWKREFDEVQVVKVCRPVEADL